jgi:hypothetical protein
LLIDRIEGNGATADSLQLEAGFELRIRDSAP